MKKRIIASLLSAFCIVYLLGGWTMWVPTIGDGSFGYFNAQASFTYGSSVTYDSLSDVCLQINMGIADGTLSKMEPFYSYPSGKWVAQISTYGSYNPTRYIIELRNTSASSQPVWYLVNSRNGFIYASSDTKTSEIINPLINSVETSFSALISLSNTIASRLSSIITYVDGLENLVTQTNSKLDSISGYVDGIEGLLTTQSAALSDIYGAVRNGVWVTGYTSYSDNTDYPYIAVSEDAMEGMVSFLNTHYMGQQVRYLDRDSDFTESSLRYFAGASVSNGELRIYVKTSPTGTAQLLRYVSPRHFLYKISSDSVRKSQFFSAIDGVESFLASIDSKTKDYSSSLNAISNKIKDYTSNFNLLHTDLTDLYADLRNGVWVTGYTAYSDDSSYPSIPVSQSALDQMVAYLNSNYMGQRVRYLSQDADFVSASERLFAGASVVDGYLRIYVQTDGGVNQLLWFVSPRHFLIRASSENNLYAKLDAIERALVNVSNNGTVNNDNSTNINVKLTGIATATANIEVSIGSLIDSMELGFDDININLGSIVDRLGLGFDDMSTAIANLPSGDLVPYVDDIENYIDTLEGYNSSQTRYLDDLNNRVNDIYDWLTSNDLLDVQYISDLVTTWGDSVSFAVLNSNNILGLFYSAFGNVPDDIDWGEARSYFNDFYTGVT